MDRSSQTFCSQEIGASPGTAWIFPSLSNGRHWSCVHLNKHVSYDLRKRDGYTPNHAHLTHTCSVDRTAALRVLSPSAAATASRTARAYICTQMAVRLFWKSHSTLNTLTLSYFGWDNASSMIRHLKTRSSSLG